MCVCVCVCVWERKRDNTEYTENSNCFNKEQEQKMSQQCLQREEEGAYVVTFSLSSFTRTTSWERGGVLTTY